MSASTRFHLIRHGAVAPEWRGRIYGDLDVPLSAVGEAELRAAADALKRCELAAVISSGLARAEFGAALLRRERGLTRRDAPALRELSRGTWGGLTFEELEHRSPGSMRDWRASPSARPPGGESLDDLVARVAPCVDALASEFPGAEVAVVTHSWVTRVLAALALGLGAEGAHRFDLGTGRMVTLDWPSDGARGRAGGRAGVMEDADPGGPAPTLASFSTSFPPARAVRWHRGPRASSG